MTASEFFNGLGIILMFGSMSIAYIALAIFALKESGRD